MATKSQGPAEAYAEVLDNLSRARSRPDAYDPRPGRRPAADEAAYAVLDARRVMESACGPAAARLAEAEADVREARRLLAAARVASAAGARVRELHALGERERAAVERAEKLIEPARAEAEAMAARVGLDVEQRALLDELRAGLADAARRLAAAASAAEPLLVAVAAADAAYVEALDAATERLAAAGFDEGVGFDGIPFPSSAGTHNWPMRIDGVPWTDISPISTSTLVADVRALIAAVEPVVRREGLAGAVLDAPLPRLGVGEVR